MFASPLPFCSPDEGLRGRWQLRAEGHLAAVRRPSTLGRMGRAVDPSQPLARGHAEAWVGQILLSSSLELTCLETPLPQASAQSKIN